MTKRRIILFFVLGALVLFALPALAADNFGLLPACINAPGGGNLCDIWPLINNIITFLLFDLSIPVLTVTIIWGGVTWTTAGGSPGNIEKGKKILSSGIIGILIAFAGWLIVDTVIKSLAGGSIVAAWQEFPAQTDCQNDNLATEQITFQDIVPGGNAPEKNWVLYECGAGVGCLDPNDLTAFSALPLKYASEEECKADGPRVAGGPETFTSFGSERTHWKCVYKAPEAPPAGAACDASMILGKSQIPEIAAVYDTSAAPYAELKTAGINIVSSGGCDTQTNGSCTSLTQIPRYVIQKLKDLKTTTGVGFRVTGGTEVGHATHGPRLPVIDFKPESGTPSDYEKLRSTAVTRFNGRGFCEQTSGECDTTCSPSNGTDHIHMVLFP